MKAVQNPSEITEEVDDEMLGRIDPEIQKDRIRQIINYQKSLYISCSSLASLSSSAASCSSLSSSGKSSSLLDLMKGGSTSLSRLFDMEHTSLSTHFTEYSGPPIIKPIYLWGSDEDEDFQGLSQWAAMKIVQPIDNGSGLGSLNGFASDSSFGERDLGFAKKRAKSKHRLMRKNSFKILPGFGIWRCRGFGFKLRLRRLRVIICGRKF